MFSAVVLFCYYLFNIKFVDYPEKLSAILILESFFFRLLF